MDPRQELLYLTEALRGYVESCANDGRDALPRIDKDTLQARREQYRNAAAPEPQQPPISDLEQSVMLTTDASSGDGGPATTFTGPVGHEAPDVDRPIRAHKSIRTDKPADPSKTASQTPVSQTPEPRKLRNPAAEVEQDPKTLQESKLQDSAARRLPKPTSINPEHSVDHVALQVLQEKVQSCVACELHAARTNTVFARGTGENGICFVGEGPGADEDAQGLPFVGAAGQLLDKMIAAMGLDRNAVYVCNIVKCRPPKNRKPQPVEIAACSSYLEQQLEALQPKVIVAMGATAVQGLLDLPMGITRLRGQWRLYRGQIPVMPTFHPAYLLRQPSAKREVWQDLQEVLREARLPLPNRKS